MSLLLLAGLSVGSVSLATYIRQRALKKAHEDAQLLRSKENNALSIAQKEIPLEPPNYWAFLARHFFKPEESDSATQDPVEVSNPSKKKSKIISPLNVTVALTLASFALSLAPDHLLGTTEFKEMLVMILVSATVGIGTNYVAIWMLFFPIKPLPVIKLQGIIPRKRTEIIAGLASGIRRNLIDEATIRQAIHDSDIVRRGIDQVLLSMGEKIDDREFRDDLADLIRQTVRAFLSNELFRNRIISTLAQVAQKLPSKAMSEWLPLFIQNRLGSMLSQKVIEHRQSILDYVDNKLDQELHQICDHLLDKLKGLPQTVESQREFLENYLTQKLCTYAGRFDVESMIRDKMQSMDESEFYQMINEVTENELANLQYLGAVLGGLAGIVMYFML